MHALKHREQTVWGHCKKAAICMPRRESAGDTRPANTLTFDSSLQDHEEINVYYVSPQNVSRQLTAL